MSEHYLMLTLVDDTVVISSWQERAERWQSQGSVHLDCLWPEALKTDWYQELIKEGQTIITAHISLNTALQLPPDNLS